jgi:phosphoribosyl 1,2-cyclic phosphate phosphodiesterase
MSVEVTFLGTGTSQGVPVIACHCDVCESKDHKDNRLRSSVLVKSGGTTIVIDTGPDFKQQMLNAKQDNLDAVLFTHEHKDHVAGLDDVRAYNWVQKNSMEVYSIDRVASALRSEFHYVFSGDDYPGIPRINLNLIENKPFSINGLEIIPIEVFHYKMPVLGFRIGDFTYITDAKTIAEEEKEKIKGSKVIVLNALRRHEHISHFTLDQAIEMMKELNPEMGYFTHISHYLGKHEDVSQELPENIHLAYDGLKITV